MSEWPMVKLKELMRKTKSIDPGKYPDEEFALYSIPAYDNGIPEKIFGRDIGSSKILLKDSDVVLSKIVPHIRRTWVITDGEKQIGSSEWIVFNDDRFDPQFIANYLKSDAFHYQLLTTVAGVGGSLNRARPAAVAELKIPLPPLGEQKRIAEILGGVSKAIQILEHELQLLGEISVLEQQNNLSTQKLSDLVTIRSGTVDPTLSVNRNLPHIAPDSIEKNTGRILQIRSCEEDKVTSGKYHFYKGDVLYSKIRPYLNKVVIAPFEGLCSADMYALRPKEGINSEVLQALLMSKDFLAYAEQWSGRASIPKINRKALLAYNVPKMTDKQVNEVKAKIQSIHKVVELKCRKLSLLQELQKSLASRAFAGLL